MSPSTPQIHCVRLLTASSMAIATSLVVGACATSNTTSSHVAHGQTATILVSDTPDTLDPQNTLQTLTQVEADSEVYLNLVEFKAANGPAGYDIIPAAAAAMPTISDSGKVYTFHLRKNLVFSDGKPMQASDFAYSAERALKLHWGFSSVLTSHVVGGAAYASGKADTITGIQTDNSTGTITIQLTSPYGAFLDYVATPGGLSIVPSNTPMKPEPAAPPLGSGPYEFKSVNPSTGFTLVQNPRFASMHIPGLPTGYIHAFDVEYVSNASAEAEEVLANRADVFNAADNIPVTLIPTIKRSAADRFKLAPSVSTNYFFLNTSVKPFNNLLARQAVNYAVDRTAISRLDGGLIEPGCYFLPAGIPGSVTGSCQFETAGGGPKLSVARQLVKRSGLAGSKVVVWGLPGTPYEAWTDYLASVLNSIGFKASEKIIAGSTYFTVVGTVRNHIQAGLNNFFLPPDPAVFYDTVFGPGTITATGNNNVSMVSDAHIDSVLTSLNGLPLTASVASQWQALDKYESNESYIIPFGEGLMPLFFSNRIDPASAVLNENFEVWASLKWS